jgi:uncharacterized hydantoinase/oxoprolinase family protein
VKNVLAKKEKKIVQVVQGHLVENEKKMQEHAEKRLKFTAGHFKQEVEGRLMENEKNIQQRLKVNEVKICGHGEEIQQKVKGSIADHDQKIKEILAKNDQKIKESIAELAGETVNEQGYFTRMIVRTPHLCLYVRLYYT